MTRVQYVIEDLARRKKFISCAGADGLLLLMEDLGFTHRAGKTEGHRVFVHKALSGVSDFKTHSVDCGHKPSRDMNFRYIVATINKLKAYKSELEVIYDEDHS